MASPSHSQSSSLADVDYYTHSLHSSSSSSLSGRSAAFPAPPTTYYHSSGPQRHRRQQSSLAHVNVPSFSAFRSQTSSIPVPSPTSPRKSLATHGRAASSSLAEKASPRLAHPSARPHSQRSPTLQRTVSNKYNYTSSPQAEKTPKPYSNDSTFSFPSRPHDRNDSFDSHVHVRAPSSTYADSTYSSIPIHARYSQQRAASHAHHFSVSSIDFVSGTTPAQRSSVAPSMNGISKPPSMKLEMEGVQRTLTDESLSSLDSPNAIRPKSPGVRLGNLFSWKKQNPESPLSPAFHRSNSMDNTTFGPRLTPPGLDVQRAGLHHRSEYFDNDETPILLGTPETNAHVRELEKELTQVSTELAESIKREMELEDEIDRMRVDIPSAPSSNSTRRSSDYFSDSGASANRFPLSDADAKFEQMEQKLRKAEQEKAQVKVDMASRLQTELSRRRDLEIMVHKLEQQLQSKLDEVDERGDVEERVEELEATLEDTKRILKQERQSKSSFEDLYTATKGELERHMSENARLQDEVATLKAKGRIGSIMEAEDTASGGRNGLARSTSLARNPSRRGGSLSRSVNSERSDGTRQRSGSTVGVVTVEGVKEIEDQRDALHKALKLLIIRSEKQQKDHEQAIKKLTNAKTFAEAANPGRSAYHKEVSFLKEEVATLRKRTEDALEQKWQYEKGLSGIKMDLDRAELETRGLRIILQEHDILGSSQKTLFGNGQGDDGADEKLQESISTAESERDQARKVAAEYRQRAQSVEDGSSAELINSARRMDELADQLEKQVQSNVALRTRLAEAVARGELEQKESNGKIGEMQKRLATMEDSVLAAQQHSETALGTHEAEVRKLEEASSPSLQRLRVSVSTANNRLTPTSPLIGGRSPKIISKKLSENSLLEMSKTQMLERKVRELEALLREAEEDMQDVVQKVNKSQLEVAELQTERDVAFNQMRKLQAQIVAERQKAETLMR